MHVYIHAVPEGPRARCERDARPEESGVAGLRNCIISSCIGREQIRGEGETVQLRDGRRRGERRIEFEE